MKVLDGLYYSKEHEWVKITGNKAYVGITDYAQESLGEIVFVELPEIASQLNVGDVLGVVESEPARCLFAHSGNGDRGKRSPGR